MNDKKKENAKDGTKKENEERKEIATADFFSLVKDFLRLQNQYNHFRIKEYKEWNEKDCNCPICVDYTVQICDEEEPKYCDGFREEWE
jgi:hypothetical protein